MYMDKERLVGLAGAWRRKSDTWHLCKKYHPLEPCWIDGGAHNGIESGFEEHTTVVKAFLQQLLSPMAADRNGGASEA